jgi:hypothetical protein
LILGGSPTYLLEHLATFTVSPENDLVYPADGMRRLLAMEKTSGIWTQKVRRINSNFKYLLAILIFDYVSSTDKLNKRIPQQKNFKTTLFHLQIFQFFLKF